MSDALVKKLRIRIHDYMKKSNYETALFWADKAVTLSQSTPQDTYLLVQSMYHVNQFDRAAKLIESKKYYEKYFIFRYLVAKCHFASKNNKLALSFLDDVTEYPSFSISLPMSKNVEGIPDDEEMQASMYLLKGDIYRALEVKGSAAECYREALKADLFCFEAFSRLVENHLMTADEEQKLLESLRFEEHCHDKDETDMVHFMYSMRLKKYNKPEKFEVPQTLDKMHESLDVATSLAERHYYNGEVKSSYNITESVMSIDPYHPLCLPLHICLLVQLKKPNKLFYLAHKLVDMYPDLAISWYAVGCFYLMQKGKQDLARRYLEKATMVDNLYGPAFLAYGHSFANGNEHDQAMAAYFKATSLMPGCHLPFLYIGLEYSVTNNPKLAESFFRTALEISPKDPHVLHELGVTCYGREDYSKALEYFNRALRQVEDLGPEVTVNEWEPLLNNLGHVHRKLKNFDRSLDFHRKALALAPNSAQTYASVALAYCYIGDFKQAIEHLHRSLSLCHDNSFAHSLLENVLEQYCKDEIPEFVPPTHNAPCTSGEGDTATRGPTIGKLNSIANIKDTGTSSVVVVKPGEKGEGKQLKVETPDQTGMCKDAVGATSTPYPKIPMEIGDASSRFSEEDMELDDTL